MKQQWNPAALTARPGTASAEPPLSPGLHTVPPGQSGAALLYLPPTVPVGRLIPLLVTLHGAGGDAEGGLSLLQPLADRHRLVLLAPSSRGSTWDGIRRGYGPDVVNIDSALDWIFRTVAIDPQRVAIAGFSDGASYALGLGLANGDLFQRIIAFSPGFIPPAPRLGRPGIFISHGDGDQVLPIESTSRRIVPALRRNGYDLSYHEFKGGHTVPRNIAQEAVSWLGWDRPE